MAHVKSADTNTYVARYSASIIACSLTAIMTLTLPKLSTASTGIQSTLQSFQLELTDGTTETLTQTSSDQLHVVCFLGTQCPMARNYGPKLQRMFNDYRDQGVRFTGVMSNVQDSLADIQKYTAELGVSFPIGKDHDQKVANLFGATRTPEVFIVDPSGTIRYSGRIDNQYQPGVARSAATENDLQDAIQALLSGHSPKKPRTVAIGCLIGRNQKAVTDFSVTYCDQIVRIMNRNCVECHRENEIGPFRLDQYEELVGWGEMCVEVIREGRMPPWHATDKYQEFANARQMTPQDKNLLERWVDAGMPYGDSNDLPSATSWVSGWRLPQDPDAVIAMSESSFQVPAEGTVDYQYFVADPKFSEDRWVRAAEVIPGDASVVHHCIVFVRPPDGSAIRESGLLSAYVPGQKRSPLPSGYAQKIPAGSRLVFQMHYTPNGKATEDLTKLGLVFTEKDQVTHEVIAVGGVEQEFEIPPNTADHRVRGQVRWYPRDGKLISIMPHMHLRGKAFTFHAEKGDVDQTLLEVPAYDFNWQHNYELAQPFPLSEVQSLHFTAAFDNSTENPHNPDPNQTVTWGDQTWEEMAVVFLNVARPMIGQQTESRSSDQPQETDQMNHDQNLVDSKQQSQEAKLFARNYIQRFDSNSDGYLEQHELPNATKIYLFRRLDRDRDGRIDVVEVEKEAIQRSHIPQNLLNTKN